MRGIQLILFLLLSGFGLAPLQAQVHIFGRVINSSSENPIDGAVIQILDRSGKPVAARISDETGAFSFILADHGGYNFQAHRIGYRETTTPTLWTDGRDSVHVEIRLDTEAVLLAPLEVTAWSVRDYTPVLAGFHARMEIGIGHFFTRAEIEELRPTLVTDVVAMVPGVRLESSGRGNRRKIYMSRAIGGQNCPAQIFVDGFLLNGRSNFAGDSWFTLDDAVSPNSVQGIEIYRGLSTVPAEFLNGDSNCGVVAVWTRRGG